MRYFEIQAEQTSEPFPGNRPKYLHALECNWSGVYDPKKQLYLCAIEAKDDTVFKYLIQETDSKEIKGTKVDKFLLDKDPSGKLNKADMRVGEWQL